MPLDGEVAPTQIGVPPSGFVVVTQVAPVGPPVVVAALLVLELVVVELVVVELVLVLVVPVTPVGPVEPLVPVEPLLPEPLPEDAAWHWLVSSAVRVARPAWSWRASLGLTPVSRSEKSVSAL
jgi:hypothetical protein